MRSVGGHETFPGGRKNSDFNYLPPKSKRLPDEGRKNQAWLKRSVAGSQRSINAADCCGYFW